MFSYCVELCQSQYKVHINIGNCIKIVKTFMPVTLQYKQTNKGVQANNKYIVGKKTSVVLYVVFIVSSASCIYEIKMNKANINYLHNIECSPFNKQ